MYIEVSVWFLVCEGYTVCIKMPLCVQWDLSIKDTLGPANMSTVEVVHSSDIQIVLALQGSLLLVP